MQGRSLKFWYLTEKSIGYEGMSSTSVQSNGSSNPLCLPTNIGSISPRQRNVPVHGFGFLSPRLYGAPYTEHPPQPHGPVNNTQFHLIQDWDSPPYSGHQGQLLISPLFH